MEQNDNNANASNRSPFAITTKQAAQRYSVSTRTLAHWRAQGMPCLMPGRRKTLFVVHDADAWVKDRFAIGRPKPTLDRLAASGGAA